MADEPVPCVFHIPPDIDQLQAEISDLKARLSEVLKERDEWQSLAERANIELNRLRSDWKHARKRAATMRETLEREYRENAERQAKEDACEKE